MLFCPFRVISVGVTTAIDTTEVELIASKGKEGTFFAKDFDGLLRLVPSFIEVFMLFRINNNISVLPQNIILLF